MSAEGPAPERLLVLLQIEKEARDAENEAALRYLIVNRTRTLLSYRQALLFEPSGAGLAITAASDVSAPDRDAPYIRWMEKLAGRLRKEGHLDTAYFLTVGDLSEAEREGWREWGSEHNFWLPLWDREQRLCAILLLSRDEPWGADDPVLAERLAETFAHALMALHPRSLRPAPRMKRAAAWLLPLLIIALLSFPVRQSVLAPAEVTPRDPVIVAAPLDGVIASFHVTPNEAVKSGQELFFFEDTVLRNALEIASEELAVAEAELRNATQGSFADSRQRARIALLQSERDVRQAKRDYAAEKLSRIQVRAERAGIAVFRDPNDWIGRPVRIGEKVLQIADPERLELRMELPVADAIVLEKGAEVRLFLNVDPLQSLAARLHSVSYEAELSASDVLSYRAIAYFEGEELPRLGLRGTAKIQGGRVPLAYYLFRRPLSALRQMLGF